MLAAVQIYSAVNSTRDLLEYNKNLCLLRQDFSKKKFKCKLFRAMTFFFLI